MKTRKRSKLERAFSHGLRAGLKGYSEDFCPYQEIPKRGEWFAGWREGRGYFMEGYKDGFIIPETRMHYHIIE